MPSWIKDVWEILQSKTSIRPMIAVAILGTLLLVSLKSWWVISIGVSGLTRTYLPLIFIAVGFSYIMLTIYAVEAGWKIFAAHHKINKRFHNLADDEKQVLARFAGPNRNVNTEMMWPHERGVGTLLDDQMLFKAAPALDDAYTLYGLTPAAREFIKKHRGAKLLYLLTIRQG